MASENAGGPPAAAASVDAVAELTRQLQEKTKKIEKLAKYIANLETDGDRLNRELIVANSHKTCFESITNPLFMVNSSLQIEFVNKAFCDFIGSTPEEFQSKPSCSEVLNCGTFRKRCLLKECFATKEHITGVKCSFVSAAGRKFAFLADALPIHNIATSEILGGFEIFREVDEDTVRKYLMFESGDHQYGVDVKWLKCIVRLPAITPMVNVSDHVRGVINLRGQIIPIYDLNCILGLKPMESSERQCVLVFEGKAQGETRSFGFVVDQVCEIRAISAKEIEPAPDVCGNRVGTFVAGILKIDRQARVIIDAFSLCNREAQTELSLPELRR